MVGIQRVLRTLCCLLCAMASAPLLGQGIILPAGGPVNRGMGGATTGTAIEAIGSMYWNPATINRLPQDEMAFGFEAIYGNAALSSAFPGVGAGATEAETGAVPVPTISWVHHTNNRDVTWGLGIFGVGGFSTNFRADAANPILSPPFAFGGTGTGGIKSDAVFFEFNPALSVRVSDRLAVGFGPVVGMGKVSIDENVLVGANANGTYPRGDGTRYHWGLGAQLGFHYVHNCCWELGANLKTPVWFEPFRYFSEDLVGGRRIDKVDVTLPLIATGGVAYRGIEYVILTADVRYFDYTSTDGFGDSAGYNLANNAVTGLGWNDLFSLGLGADLQLTPRLSGRVGYIYASELFDDADTFFNVASELSYRHVPTMGLSFRLNDETTLSVAYNYVAEWGSSGPYVLPGAPPVPGSSVTTEYDAHILTLGVNAKY